MTRDCPHCKQYLKEYPTLRFDNVTDQELCKNGDWQHVTWRGKLLHKHVMRVKEQSNV